MESNKTESVSINRMNQTASSRRGFLRKAGGIIGAAGILSAAVTKKAEAARGDTEITISELDGQKIRYRIVFDTDSARGSNANEGNDRIYTNKFGNSVAAGIIRGGSDRCIFPRQVRLVLLDSTVGNYDGNGTAGDVRVQCEAGWGYTGPAAVNVFTKERRIGRDVRCYFCVRDGKVRRPYDNSLEDQDDAGNNAFNPIPENCGECYVNGAEDHFNTNGRLERMRVQFRGQYRFYFRRRIGKKW